MLRIFRLIRVVRLLRRHGGKTIVRTLTRDRAGSALLMLLLIGILVLQFGSLIMLGLEHGAQDANIVTASDALRYMIVTMATVGYGDRYPVTTAERELGAFVLVVGVGIFGTLWRTTDSWLGPWLLSPRPQTEPGTGSTGSEVARVATDQ